MFAQLLEIPFDFLTRIARYDIDMLGLAVLLILTAATEIGFRIGRMALLRRRSRAAAESERSSSSFVTASMLGLFAFLLGVAFSMASSRYDMRRQSVLDEANAIGTVWLRAQMVGGAEGTQIQTLLRDYTALRIAAVRELGHADQQTRINQDTNAVQTRIWALATTVARAAPTPISGLLASASNEMFDLALTSRRNFHNGVPSYVLRLLMVVSMLGVGAMGYNFGISGARQLIITGLLLLAWTAAIVLVVDIDSSGIGAIRVDPTPLLWTQQGFGPAP